MKTTWALAIAAGLGLSGGNAWCSEERVHVWTSDVGGAKLYFYPKAAFVEDKDGWDALAMYDMVWPPVRPDASPTTYRFAAQVVGCQRGAGKMSWEQEVNRRSMTLLWARGGEKFQDVLSTQLCDWYSKEKNRNSGNRSR